MMMKKYVEIPMEVLERLVDGKCVEGSLRKDKWTGKITFRCYNRKPYVKPQTRLIALLEHGWVKESAERIKMFESIPKAIGTARMMAVLDRETSAAKDALIDRELIEFC